MRNLVVLGPPFSGKSTQGRLLSEASCYFHLSVGDLLRNEIKDRTALGSAARNYVRTGAMVPNELVIEMVGMVLARPNLGKGLVFDGIPRTLPQNADFQELLATYRVHPPAYIQLSVPDPVLERRAIERAIQGNREDDSIEHLFVERMRVYKAETLPLIRQLEKKSRLLRIDGHRPPEIVHHEILKTLREFG
jgi:adenylate kinase